MQRNQNKKSSTQSNSQSKKQTKKRKAAESNDAKKDKSPLKKKKIYESDSELLPLVDPASPIDPREEDKNDVNFSKKSVFFINFKHELGNEEKTQKQMQKRCKIAQ